MNQKAKNLIEKYPKEYQIIIIDVVVALFFFVMLNALDAILKYGFSFVMSTTTFGYLGLIVFIILMFSRKYAAIILAAIAQMWLLVILGLMYIAFFRDNATKDKKLQLP